MVNLMGVQIGERQAVLPARSRAIEAHEEFFYPAEAASVLGLHNVEYRQLRRLLELVRGPRSVESSRWARFSLADVAGLQIAVGLLGGSEVFERGRRMRIQPLEKAVESLRLLGFANPLVQVPLERQGNQIVARIHGVLVDPQTGQGLLVSVAERMETRALDSGSAEAMGRLRRDLARLRREMPRKGMSEGPTTFRLV